MSAKDKNLGAMRGFRCPVCASNMRVTGTRMESKLLRAAWLQCQNHECGASFKATTTLDYFISPSGLSHDLPLPIRNKAQTQEEEESS